MFSPSTFIAEVKRLTVIVNDTNLLDSKRIMACCELTRMYNGYDSSATGRIIRKIEDIMSDELNWTDLQLIP
jgi:hypothetical protein